MSGIIKSNFESVKGNLAFPKSYPTSLAEVVKSFPSAQHSDVWVKLDMSPLEGEGHTVLVSLSYLKSANNYTDFWEDQDGVMKLKEGTTITMSDRQPVQYGMA